MRGATKSLKATAKDIAFQSTLPVRGATKTARSWSTSQRISIHAPRAGSDDKQVLRRVIKGISIHAPRAGSDDGRAVERAATTMISIHAPRAGSDRSLETRPYTRTISIHAPRAGSDHRAHREPKAIQAFQSTLPVRGATGPSCQRRSGRNYFNPRSPCGERLLKFESLFGFSNNSCMVIRFLAAPSSLL